MKWSEKERESFGESGGKQRRTWTYGFLGLLGLLLLVKMYCGIERSAPAQPLGVIFQGEYKYGDGDWAEYTETEWISAVKGDVTFRGKLLLCIPDGEIFGPVTQGTAIALYFNHIGAEIIRDGQVIRTFDSENPRIGAVTCGKQWSVYICDGTESESIEFVIHNPHRFGNALAVDEFLDSMSIYGGQLRNASRSSEQILGQLIGIGVLVTSVLLLGVALFSALTGLKENSILWKVGLTILFAGGYFLLNSVDGGAWDWWTSIRSAGQVLCIMIYTVLLQALIRSCLYEHLQKTGTVCVTISGVATGLCIGAAITELTGLYDTVWVWSCVQLVTAIVFCVCIIFSFRHVTLGRGVVLAALLASQLTMIIDIVSTAVGWWQGGMLSQYMFGVLYVTALVLVLQIIPQNIRAGLVQKELRIELEREKTAVLLSQIQPHFLYNSLGAIRELCRQDPEEACEALNAFSDYLRGNMDSLKSEHVIHFSKELSHVKTYLQLEKLRFGDNLKVVYEIQTDDFLLPPLTVQPLVENAVKHGICSKEDGGCVTLRTERVDGRIKITVMDDGIGFQPSDINEQERIGIQNVKKRVQYVGNGQLEIESEPGKGTIAVIWFPEN